MNINLTYRLLSLFIMVTLTTNGIAQDAKTLSVKKVSVQQPIEPQSILDLFDENDIEYNSIETVNWNSFPYKPKVRFRIAHTGDMILIHYNVKEDDIMAVADHDDGEVWKDSCVEFFISPNRDSCYYNIESSCIGMLVLHGGIVGKERPSAEQVVLSSVKRWSSLGDKPFKEHIGKEEEWNLTLAIPAKALFLHSLEDLDGKTMTGNFYKCGDSLQKPHYLSWSPIDLEKPAFHCPQFFGTIVFE